MPPVSSPNRSELETIEIIMVFRESFSLLEMQGMFILDWIDIMQFPFSLCTQLYTVLPSRIQLIANFLLC